LFENYHLPELFLYMCPDNGLTAKTAIKPHEALNLRKKFHTVATLKNSILSFMHL